ncbi:MAG: hypothetical protein E6G66_18340 [Actinobacteria bacterium]|nr:MAG: hypothetical protein E6G66_18340 [Actinomycetota bacterium]
MAVRLEEKLMRATRMLCCTGITAAPPSCAARSPLSLRPFPPMSSSSLSMPPRCRRATSAAISFDWAIMVSGFTSTLPQHAHLFRHKLTIPSLHVTGQADTLVPMRDSLLLAERFSRPVIIEHRGGFEDYWNPFLGGQGPAPSYAMSLDDEHRATLRERIRASLPIAADGSVSLVARAWAIKGQAA